MLRTSDLDYELPETSIATEPATPRDSARLLVMKRGDPTFWEDRRVADLPVYLRRGDLLVVNTSRVLRARFEGVRLDTGGRIDGLFLSEVAGAGEGRWECLIRAKKVRAGMVLAVGRGGQDLLRLHVIEPREGEAGAWLVEARWPDGRVAGASAADVLGAVGLTPLPPYIVRARRHSRQAIDEDADHERYQTVYAAGEAGSVAAPTAGLHFTPALLQSLQAAGVGLARVTLHVGTGTFRPVETEFVEDHPMHAEWCSVSMETAERVQATRSGGGRVFAVGTTAARTLEAYAGSAERGECPASLSTRILITPGYRWRWVDGLLTNFHLPRSTLMAMVASLLEGTVNGAHGECGGGVSGLLGHYRRALAAGYRFYSFGDATLVLP